MDGNNLASAAEPGSERRSFSREWDGELKLVVGVDIGTTSSQVSFTFLEPGGKQTVHRVTQWPGQEPQSRIPSLIWYDSNNQPVSFGAEARAPKAEDRAEDEGWQLVQCFNLHLHPSDLRAKCNQAIEPLPFGVPLLQVYSDFLRYLLRHTQPFFEDRILDGRLIWQRYHKNMAFVIAHPNEYGIREQVFLRSAAVAAGFTTSENAASHINFVTEAEASAHFCLYYTNLEGRLRIGANIAICDAGHSTVHATLYTVRDISPVVRLQKLRQSIYIQAGDTLVDKLAEAYLRQLFEKAGLLPDEINEYVTRGMWDFERLVKKMFCETTRDYVITVAHSRFNSSNLRIRRGLLTLAGRTIQSFFDRCVSEIIASISSQVTSIPVSHILLVGSFGDQPYLRQRLKNQFEPMGIQLVLTNDSTSGAVADGTVLWHCASDIIERTPPRAFGTEIDVPFDQSHPEHCDRAQTVKSSGTYISGRWLQLAPGGVPINGNGTCRQSHTREYSGPDADLGILSEKLYTYPHDDSPNWIKNNSGEILDGFQELLTVTADLSGMREALQPRISARGAKYWALTFNLCVRFSRTRSEAFLEWAEKDDIKAIPAKVTMHQ